MNTWDYIHEITRNFLRLPSDSVAAARWRVVLPAYSKLPAYRKLPQRLIRLSFIFNLLVSRQG